jgi:hypothetical protein
MTQGTDDLTFTNEEWVDKTIPEDTLVRARLDSIKLNVRKWTPKPGQRGYDANNPGAEQEIRTLEWWWEVLGPEPYTGRRLKGECKPEMNENPRNRLRRWAAALLQREIPVGGRLSIQDLTGLQAQISVVHKPDKNDPTMKWEEVDEVIPASSFADDEPPF